MTVRTRFAPSPTGSPHVGSAHTALFNWLFARSAGGQFIVRIEDTDTARRVDNAAEMMMRALRWLGLNWDEGPGVGGPSGPYVQSQRLPLYQRHATRLVERGLAYRCFCSRERLQQVRTRQAARHLSPHYDGRCRDIPPQRAEERADSGEAFVIRFRTPADGETVVRDILRGDTVFHNGKLGDFVLLKSDGYPTYHLASVVDDHHMRISHVLRAEEWLPSTPLHLLLYEAFGWEPPAFAHLPLILEKDRSKLSKRSGDNSVLEYRRLGYLPEALVHYLSTLGWTPKSGERTLSPEELARLFSLKQLSRSPSVFDTERLNWFNRKYLKRLPVESLAEHVAPYLKEAYGCATRHDGTSLSAQGWLHLLVEAVRDELSCLSDIANSSRFAFAERPEADEDARKALAQPHAAEVLRAFADGWTRLPSHDYDTVEAFFDELRKELKSERGLSGKSVMQTVRAALTGSMKGPCLVAVAALLGRERCLARVRTVLAL